MKHIKITKHYKNLNPGEVAVFEDEEAEYIIGKERGVEVPGPKAAKSGKDATSTTSGAADSKAPA